MLVKGRMSPQQSVLAEVDQLSHVVSGFCIGLAIGVTLAMPVTAAAARELWRDIAADFDIAAQPLASALARYGDLTRLEAFYQAHLVEGRISSRVSGRLAPSDALAMLLEGTSLRARFLDDGSFVLSPLPPQEVARLHARQLAGQRYYAQIQTAIRTAFCRQQGLQPGTLRMVALIWIGAHGQIERVHQLSSNGAAIDGGIEAAFLSVRLDERPPADFAQPALIMMVPNPGQASNCGIQIGATRAGRP